jgi:hypothetical protein
MFDNDAIFVLASCQQHETCGGRQKGDSRDLHALSHAPLFVCPREAAAKEK